MAEEDCIMSSFIIVRYADGTKEDESGGACSTRGTDEECIQEFGRKT